MLDGVNIVPSFVSSLFGVRIGTQLDDRRTYPKMEGTLIKFPWEKRL